MPIRYCHATNDTQHSASICTVNGRRRNWTSTLECSTCVCTNILSKTSVYSDTATILRHFRHGLRSLNSKEELSKYLLVKHIATLGPRPQRFGSCEVRFLLNRVIRWIVPPFEKEPERIEIEADPRRHSELLIKNFWFANKQHRSEHTRRAFERQFTHNQTFITRFHIIPFQCHAARVLIS